MDLVVGSAIKNPYFLQSVEEDEDSRPMRLEARKYLYDIQRATSLKE